MQKWRKVRNARLSLPWYSVARGRQQENSHRQVWSARASPLTFSPVAGQCGPATFLTSQKMARNVKCAFFVAMALGCARQAAGETLTSKSGLPELAPLLSTRSPVSPDRLLSCCCSCQWLFSQNVIQSRRVPQITQSSVMVILASHAQNLSSCHIL